MGRGGLCAKIKRNDKKLQHFDLTKQLMWLLTYQMMCSLSSAFKYIQTDRTIYNQLINFGCYMQQHHGVIDNYKMTKVS